MPTIPALSAGNMAAPIGVRILMPRIPNPCMCHAGEYKSRRIKDFFVLLDPCCNEVISLLCPYHNRARFLKCTKEEGMAPTAAIVLPIISYGNTG